MRSKAVEQSTRLLHLELGAAVFPPAGADHLASGEVRDELHAVADGENRRDVEDGGIDDRRALLVDGARSAAEDDAGRVPLANPVERPRRRVNLRVHARLTHAPGDELSELRPAIDDEDS